MENATVLVVYIHCLEPLLQKRTKQITKTINASVNLSRTEWLIRFVFYEF